MSQDPQQARKALGVEADATAETIEQAHANKKAILEKKRDEAPTDALREKIERALKQLDEARDLLLAEASGDASAVPSDSGSSAPSRGASPLSDTKMADLPSTRASATRIDEGTAGAAVDLGVGDVLAERYAIVERIGAGGMGAVYHAKDRTRDEDVALKVLLPGMVGSTRARDRFLDEARLSSKLSHPGIVNVYDVQSDGDYVFLSMELLEGQDLRALLDTRQLSRQEFDEAEAKQLGTALCEALAYAHQHTVHRDIKPENVWVTEDGAYKLMDFGIARVMSNSERTKTGMAMGTAYYMAPEQLKGTGSVDGRADQYALAVLLYEVLTGEVPAGRIKPLREKRKDLSKGFAAAIDRALEPDPDDRFADMEEFGKALASGKAKAPKRSRTAARTPSSGGGPGWLPWAGGIAAVVVVAVVFGGNVMGARDAFMGLFPDPQAEARALALDGEIATLEDRLEAREEAFRQRLDDAERLVSGLERDLRNADDASEEQQLEAELERARTELKYAESIVDLGRRAIFESDLYTETVSAQSIGERKLRNEDWQAADKALSQAQSGLTTLLERAEGLPNLVPTRAEALATKRQFSRVVDEAGFADSEAAANIRSLYDEADTLAASGEFSRAADQYKTARNKATAVHRLFTETRPNALATKESWRNAAQAADLTDDKVAKQIRQLYKKADEKLASNELKAAERSYSEAQKMASDAEAFADAKASRSVSKVGAYRDRHPDGVYRAFADATAWEHAQAQDNIAAYDAYLEAFPKGGQSDRARAARKQLFEAQKAAAAVEAAKRRVADDRAWNKASATGTIEAAQEYLSKHPDGRHVSAANALIEFLSGESFRAGGVDLEFAGIPGGRFRMGYLSGKTREHGLPVRLVDTEPFRMMVHEVTFAQWDACVEDGGCSYRPDDEGWGRGTQPVINVSWEDVTQQFIPWLNQETGSKFRLPTEAEWEYAARAGSTTRYSWGNNIGYNNAVCDGCGSTWDEEQSAPVKSFSANAFGLYDMHGNVWEWTQDCWHGSYEGGPVDGSAWTEGKCNQRVLRSGAWGDIPLYLRSAFRFRLSPTARSYFYEYDYSLGFRLVQSR